jgi:hypothetical protein
MTVAYVTLRPAAPAACVARSSMRAPLTAAMTFVRPELPQFALMR